jgi:predicted DNA binding CopG/RHH family protein
MKKNYDLKKMEWKPNPYAKRLKKSITIRVDNDVLAYFQQMATERGLPYQTMLNLFLRSCKEGQFKPQFKWAVEQ